MAEYIDRDALLLRIDCHGTNKFGMLDEDIRVFVKAQPAADVAPVVHGEWLEYLDEMKCSACKRRWNYCDNDTNTFNFCPNCGAKMDGGDNDATD